MNAHPARHAAVAVPPSLLLLAACSSPSASAEGVE